MEDVAHDHDLAPRQAPAGEVVAERVQVEEGLAGVGMPAIAGVDHVPAKDLRREVGRSAACVAHHEHVGAERFQRARRVQQRLALGDRAGRRVHARDVGPEATGRDLEGHPRARRGLIEKRDHGLPLEARAATALLEHAAHLGRAVEHGLQFPRREIRHVEQVRAPGHEAADSAVSAARSMNTPSPSGSVSSRWTLDELLARGGHVLAHVIGPDRQLAVTPVDEHGEADRRRPPVIHERIHGGADRASREEHVVDDDHGPAGEVEGQVRALHHWLAGDQREVVAVEGDVERADRRTLALMRGDRIGQAMRRGARRGAGCPPGPGLRCRRASPRSRG